MTFAIPSNYSILKTPLSISTSINSASGQFCPDTAAGSFTELVARLAGKQSSPVPERTPGHEYLAHGKRFLQVAGFCRRHPCTADAAAEPEQDAVGQEHMIDVGVAAFTYYAAAESYVVDTVQRVYDAPAVLELPLIPVGLQRSAEVFVRGVDLVADRLIPA